MVLDSEQRMRGVAKRRLAKRELIGRNGVKFVHTSECWTGSQQILIWRTEVTHSEP